MIKRKNKYALISVYDKRGIVNLTECLIDLGYKIIATEGTGREIQKYNIPFIYSQKVSGNPKCFDGFMKTLSFSIEGGIIFDRKNSLHTKEAEKFGIKDIDIVVCNFFPVKAVLEDFREKETEEILRYFDFGGPIMVRVAAQNYKNVLVLIDPSDYILVTNSHHSDGLSIETKKQLASKAFNYLIGYDKEIVEFLNSRKNDK